MPEFVWIFSPRGPSAQIWHEETKPIEKRQFLQKHTLTELDLQLSLTQLAEKYPFKKKTEEKMSGALQIVDTPPNQAIKDIFAERLRQISGEEWSYTHDDQHTDGALARAAATYAYMSTLPQSDIDQIMTIQPNDWRTWIHENLWPKSWGLAWLKPKNRRYDLVRAGALIVAEIERLDRAEKK